MATHSDRSFDNFDFCDFAQEFLRRNPNYQAQFAELTDVSGLDAESPEFTKLAKSWGLEFRLPA